MITRWILAFGIGAVGAALACSSDDGENSGNAGGNGAVGGAINIPVGGAGGVIGGAGGASGASGGGAVNGAGGAPSSCNPSLGGSCVGVAYAGENLPLDIYIMFDQSGSMCTCVDPPTVAWLAVSLTLTSVIPTPRLFEVASLSEFAVRLSAPDAVTSAPSPR